MAHLEICFNHCSDLAWQIKFARERNNSRLLAAHPLTLPLRVVRPGHRHSLSASGGRRSSIELVLPLHTFEHRRGYSRHEVVEHLDEVGPVS